MRRTIQIMLGCLLAGPLAQPAGAERVLLWGDTHLHTRYSGDAYALQNRSVSPEDSYRFARGEPVVHPFTGARVQLHTPLDFLVVSDHAEYMGVFQLVESRDERLLRSDIGQQLIANAEAGRDAESFFLVARSLNQRKPYEELLTRDIRMPIWERIIDAAEAANDPGRFTALIGWEWSSLPNGNNLHRVVFTPDGGDRARRFLPYSSLDDDTPEALWDWLAARSAEDGTRFVSIPHNSNISGGLMFAEADSDGRPISAGYARTRMRWEPVVEVLQVKGASETHPRLSPTDEFADYEIFEKVMNFAGDTEADTADPGNYMRGALRRGLEIAARVGVNPYQFGVIGSTDSHTGLSTAEEDNFHGKYGVDGPPANLMQPELTPGATGIDMGAQGLAAVWADDNTRDAIYAAFQRREVYATSGPRIRLRLFGGFDFRERDADAADIAAVGYRKGVPMGGDLSAAPRGKAPRLLIHAAKDPESAGLERVQVVKGWLDDEGQSRERVYDAAVSGNTRAGAPPEAADLVTRAPRRDGETEFALVWTDPDFDAGRRAFYYVRVLEVATARHSLYDTVALGVPHPRDYPSVIRERAISSPVWYTP